MKKFAERLQEAQKQRGLSQKEMAKMIGITPASLSAYMRDAKTPALDIAVKIANALGVSIGWLCGESQSPSNMSTYEDLLRNIVELVDTSGIYFVVRGGSAKLDTHGFFKYSEDDFNMHIEQARARGKDPNQVEYMALETANDTLGSFLFDWSRVRDLRMSGTVDDEMYEGWLEKRFRNYGEQPLPGRNPK